MTGRQRVGVVLICLVLVMTAVVANLGTHLVAGTGQAAPIPGPPAVGDCITDPIEPSWSESRSQSDQPGTTPSTYGYLAMNVSSCTGNRFGEVVSVIANPAKLVVTSDGASSSTHGQQPGQLHCYRL